jgi:hypothetical protein
MLHIHNGDCSSNIARQTSLPGEHFAFREALIEGPTPSDLTPADWRKLRARHLSEAYGVDQQKCVQELLEQEQALEGSQQHDEVVLWFEHDLFCQANLIYLLDWFARNAPTQTKLSLICIDDFPGRKDFRGLGELTPAELASLFPSRQPVTRQQLRLASSAWRAYAADNPTEIQTLLKTDTSALPFLDAAMKAHLKRFPSTRNGLGRVEDRGLELIHSGVKRFEDLFPRFGKAEPVYGMGDAQFWLALNRMSKTLQPLLEIKNGQNGQKVLTSDSLQKAEFEITDLGEAVLNGEADFVTLNGIELWLGGVYLSGDEKIWRWDDASHSVVRC